MVFARWDPFRDLIRIQHGLERLASHGPQGWAPAVDLCETANAFIFTAELPGLSREQVRIDVHENRLTLQGRRDARVSCDKYHQVERGHGEFLRHFVLPHPVNADSVVADLTDGILTITVPKLPAEAPKRVVVA
ncbi:MAG TPA: Hsp20/alpha crystallin family protein [Vicinamibacterales bacterium]|nr:Hsp20/alpha crystallin family protein [Vicinamibacterales bacterium]